MGIHDEEMQKEYEACADESKLEEDLARLRAEVAIEEGLLESRRVENVGLRAQRDALVEALEEFMGAAHDAVVAINEMGYSCPSSIGLAEEHARAVLAAAKAEATTTVTRSEETP